LILARPAPGFEGFRGAARRLLASNTPPEEITWQAPSGQVELFGHEAMPVEPSGAPRPRVPKAYVELAEPASFHRDTARFDVLYRVLYRLLNGEPCLLDVASDQDVTRLRGLAQSVQRDVHKMHAFVRFRRVLTADGERFVAWHRPEHPILQLAAPFFRDRFPSMHWSILTPDASCFWDGKELVFAAGAPRSAAPSTDELEDMLLTYYRAIFNPARLNLRAMQAEMPVKHWPTLPEARVIGELLRDSPGRVRQMLESAESASAAFLPDVETLASLAAAAAGCTACPLHAPATRTVFGEGPAAAELMLVGEQPGDEEDLQGRPFVGPAGRVLNEALERAGIERSDVYVTNAVKHFKFMPRGKRRLHQRPRAGEVISCRAWLDAELRAIKPRVIVCLGNTAAQSFLGNRFNLQRYRGHAFRTPWAEVWLATYHPAAILRALTSEARDEAFAALVADLRTARQVLRTGAALPLDGFDG
jgi:probable DNA metabolism protein